MRIRRLDLTRYGKFTNHTLDFGETQVGRPDLHILYGPNEAGKSTTLSAWLDLLFGIEQQTRYSFLHQGPTMRVGAVLEIGGKEVAVTRIKTKTNSLLNGFDAPIPEAVLQGALGGLGREAYRSMFSLDDETLVEGGESILASQGDLGELLFSTSAGLTGLSKRLKGLQGNADAFIKTARTGRLFDLKKQLDALEAERKAIDVQAPDYARRVEAVRAADLAWKQANSSLATANSNLAMLSRVDAGLPLTLRLQRLMDKVAAAVDAPVPPPEWAADFKDLMADTANAEAKAEILRSNILRLTQRLTESPEDDLVLGLSAQIAEAEALRSAHDEAVKDLPSRINALQAEEAVIAALMARLSMTGRDPQEVLLPAASISGLRSLIATHSGLQTALTTARREAEDSAALLKDAEERLADAGGVEAGPGANTEILSVLTAGIRARDPANTLRQAKIQTLAAQTTAADRIAALLPWTGTAADLAAQTVPSKDQIDQWAQKAEAARSAVVDTAAEMRRLKAELDKQLALQEARSVSNRVLPDDLAAARAERERLWARHRLSLDLRTATLFESAMRRDDLLAADRAAAGAEEAVQAQVRASVQVLRTQLTEAEVAGTLAKAAAADVTRAWAALLADISPLLPKTFTPAELRAWLDLRAQALKAAADLERLEAAQHLAAEDVAAAMNDLQSALHIQIGQAAPYQTYESLLAKASALVSAGDKLAALTDVAKSQRRVDARRQAELAKAEAASQAWHDAWQALCAGTWLQSATVPDLEVVSSQIAILEDLRIAVAAQLSLADRVEKMSANRTAFREATAAIAAQLGMDHADTVTNWHAITQRLRHAEEAQKAAQKNNADLYDATEALAVQEDILRLTLPRLTQMEEFLGVEGPDALAQALAAAAERAGWQDAIVTLQEDLIQTTRSATLDEALAMIAAVEGQDLDAMLAQAKVRAEAAQTMTQTRFAELSKAQVELDAIGGDDAVARLEETRQTILLQIQEDAQQHLRQRFGIIAVEHALRAYRDSHRSAMMARASAAFQTISQGAYTGLASQPDKDREILVALAADGTSKLAGDMSKGTRFQLYLALRAAGFHVLAEARPPVPFIADDIMETFDDDRSAEAFTLLGEMAKVGQVIYLTHHQHLCEIARRVCPDAHITLI